MNNTDKNNLFKKLIDYYDGHLNIDEAKQLEDLLDKSDEKNRLAHCLFSILFVLDANKIENKVDVEKALLKVRKKGKGLDGSKRINWWMFFQKVAVFLLIPLISLLTYQNVHVHNMLESLSLEKIEVKSNPGVVTNFFLPDSTLVYLNSNSSLRYPRSFVRGGYREVELSGEAYFEVKRNLKQRFVVHTPNNCKVEVYGTKFNVEAYKKDSLITTTLISGKVSFIYKDLKIRKKIFLQPGEKLAYNVENKKINKYITNCIPEKSWIEGLLVFDNTAFDDVLKMLTKRFNVHFRVKNNRIIRSRFTGTFSTHSLEKILKYFEISSRIQWRYLTDSDIKNDKIMIEIY